MNDHDLTVLVDAAARGACNSYVAIHGGVLWEALDPATKNNYREAALPFIFHGSKALDDLGYRKPRTITTFEELDALPEGSIVQGSWATYQLVLGDWVTLGGPGRCAVEFPATVLHEPVSA